MSKIRPAGKILLDMEPLLLELVEHELQHGDILALVKGYLDVHCPDAREEYLDGTFPVMTYGPMENLK